MSGAFDPWVGRVEEARDSVSARQARQMAATLDVAGSFDEGDPLPALWHWMGWTPEAAMAELGPDGHPAKGGFLPPVPLERRMWAGGRLEFLAPLRIGEQDRQAVGRHDREHGACTRRHGGVGDRRLAAGQHPAVLHR